MEADGLTKSCRSVWNNIGGAMSVLARELALTNNVNIPVYLSFKALFHRYFDKSSVLYSKFVLMADCVFCTQIKYTISGLY